MKKIDSNIIKAALLHYFRYKRNQICATEYSYRSMDFATITKKGLLKEVEVKISLSDLRADKKKRKHHFYKEITSYYKKGLIYPNYFYFCVPTNLIEKAKEVIEEMNNKYGLIEYIEAYHTNANFLADRISIIKQAKELHGYQVDTIYHMSLRNCSELCKFYERSSK